MSDAAAIALESLTVALRKSFAVGSLPGARGTQNEEIVSMVDHGRLPERTRVYENHHLDSPRWDRFERRPGDIVVTTAYKSGTTWMQTIVANLLFQDAEIPGAIMDFCPWVDQRARDFDDICRTTAAQSHRRSLKTHLPLDGLPYDPDVRYIYVGRDLRDVFMSLWNHYSGHTDLAYEAINDPNTLAGEPFPRAPESIKDLWKTWANRGWFDWENDGYPYFSSSHHAQTWWDYRHLPNILFVHFGDLLARPGDEIERIAHFLGIEIAQGALPGIVDAVSFDRMKERGASVLGNAQAFWEGGANRFLNKGTNGRWREVLDEKDLGEYEAMLSRTLSPECARWLEEGRSALVGAANA